MALTPVEWEKWKNTFLQELSLGQSFVQMTYYNPKINFYEEEQFYFKYINPFVLAIFTIALILLLWALWSDDFVKKFGFMATYSCLDISANVVHNIICIYVFTLKDNYVQYQMCYGFEIAVKVLPRVSLMLSQWLKVAQSCQRFLLFWKPITYSDVFNGRNVSIFAFILMVICFSVGGAFVFSIEFEKVIIVDEYMETVEICRDPIWFSENLPDKAKYLDVLDMLYVTIGYILPLIFFVILDVLCLLKIRSQNIFRRQFHIAKSAKDVNSERLIRVIIVSTVVYAVLSLIGVVWVVSYIAKTVFSLSDVLPFVSISAQIVHTLNIPFNFILFSWLSKPFRNTVKKGWSKLRSCISCSL